MASMSTSAEFEEWMKGSINGVALQRPETPQLFLKLEHALGQLEFADCFPMQYEKVMEIYADFIENASAEMKNTMKKAVEKAKADEMVARFAVINATTDVEIVQVRLLDAAEGQKEWVDMLRAAFKRNLESAAGKKILEETVMKLPLEVLGEDGGFMCSQRSKIGAQRAMCSKNVVELVYEAKVRQTADETEAANAIAEYVDEKWLEKPYDELVEMENSENEELKLTILERKAAGAQLCSEWMKKARTFKKA